MKTDPIRKISLALLALVPLAVGCTNKQGETEAPVYITTDLRLQPGTVDVCTQTNPVQFQTIILSSHLKNPNDTDPQGFATATMNQYTVTYSRLDGGTRVPPPQTFSAGCTLPAGGTCNLNNFFAMEPATFSQSPFDQLFPFNGGIDRETGNSQISILMTFRFFGETVSGHRVESEPSAADVLFFCSVAP